MSVVNILKLHERWYSLWDGLTQGSEGYITLWDLDPLTYQKLLRLKRHIMGEQESPLKAFKTLNEDGQSRWEYGLTLIEFCTAMKRRRFVDNATTSFRLLELYGGTRGGAYVRPE